MRYRGCLNAVLSARSWPCDVIGPVCRGCTGSARQPAMHTLEQTARRLLRGAIDGRLRPLTRCTSRGST